MENVIVLFGFSGADPNFRALAGCGTIGAAICSPYTVSPRSTPVDVDQPDGRPVCPRISTCREMAQSRRATEDRGRFSSRSKAAAQSKRQSRLALRPSRSREDREAVTCTPDPHDWWQRRLSGWLVAPAQNRADRSRHSTRPSSTPTKDPLAGGLAALVGAQHSR